MTNQQNYPTPSAYTSILLLDIQSSEEHIQEVAKEYITSGWKYITSEIEKAKGKSHLLYPEHGIVSQLIVCWVDQTDRITQVSNAIKLGAKYRTKLTQEWTLDLRFIDIGDQSRAMLTSLFIQGLLSGGTPMDLLKSGDKKPNISSHIKILSPADEDLASAVIKGKMMAQTINSIRAIVDLPSNKKTPVELVKWMEKSANELNYQLEIKDMEQLEKEGFHALIAVNRGSEVPASCIVAHYKASDQREDIPTLAIVGKGVTFDTGGLSIKGNRNMHYMKSDMGGAAAVMGAIDLIARLRLKINVIAVIPTTDNSVDALSIKPGDVINSYSGKTIEVIDTDAEGRLILADALSYVIQKHEPDYVIDLATLTGSVVRALGTECAGIMSKNTGLIKSIQRAGEEIGELVWPLPLWDSYHKYLNSDIADIRNLGSKPMAGAITAGKFLEYFTADHPAWAHIDIAATAFGARPGSEGYAASGYGISLLVQWAESFVKNNYQLA